MFNVPQIFKFDIEFIFRRWDVGIWTGLGGPRIEIGDGRL